MTSRKNTDDKAMRRGKELTLWVVVVSECSNTDGLKFRRVYCRDLRIRTLVQVHQKYVECFNKIHFDGSQNHLPTSLGLNCIDLANYHMILM